MARMSSRGWSLLFVALVVVAACSSGNRSSFPSAAQDGGDAGGGSLTPDSSMSFGDGSSIQPTTRDDFPNPVLDTGVPASAPTLFGAPDQGTTGPCLYEPEIGSPLPHNWLPLRFRFTTANKENLYQIKLVIPNEVDPLVIYTTQ